MSFETKLREGINKAPYGSTKRNVLKVLLGEIQQKASVTDEQVFAIVKRMVSDNTEKVLPFLKPDDPRYAALVEENKILSELLPQYWSAEEIHNRILVDGLVDLVKGAKSDGQATGVVMGHLKKISAPVEGNTVKEVVVKIRES